jgi:hypothetical protein
MLSEQSGMILEDPFLNNFFEVKRNWSSHDKPIKYDITINYLLDPLKEVCNKYLTDGRSIQLLDYILEAKEAHFQIAHLRKIYSESLLKEIGDIEMHKDFLMRCLKHFRINNK